MRQLLPAGGPGGDADPGQLARLYAYPKAGRPWVRANMVASVDGAASVNGRSGGLSGRADREIFGLLRSLADVILVGAGTVRAERYRPAQRRRSGRSCGPGAAPPRRSRSSPGGSNWIPSWNSSPRRPRTRGRSSSPATAPRTSTGPRSPSAPTCWWRAAEHVDLKVALDALGERGHQRVLTEGGPHLLGQLAAAGLLDELCLTSSPLLAGPGPGRIVDGGTIPGGLPLTLGHLLEDEGFLLGRYTVTTAERR